MLFSEWEQKVVKDRLYVRRSGIRIGSFFEFLLKTGVGSQKFLEFLNISVCRNYASNLVNQDWTVESLWQNYIT